MEAFLQPVEVLAAVAIVGDAATQQAEEHAAGGVRHSDAEKKAILDCFDDDEDGAETKRRRR